MTGAQGWAYSDRLDSQEKSFGLLSVSNLSTQCRTVWREVPTSLLVLTSIVLRVMIAAACTVVLVFSDCAKHNCTILGLSRKVSHKILN